MKKIIYFIIIVIILIAIFFGIYINYKMNFNIAKKGNLDYEYYYKKEIYGSEIATIINRAIDSNEKNNVQKDEKGFYITNNENSIIIELYITDNEKTYKSETLYNAGINKFVQNYGKILFKCTKIEYHKNTNKISYLLFEQISE